MNWRKSDTIVGVLGDHALDKDYSGNYGNVMSREQEGMKVFEAILPKVKYSGGGAANIVDLLQAWEVRVLPCGVWNPSKDHNSRILYNMWTDGFVSCKHMVDGYGTPAYVKYYTDTGEHIFRANETVTPPSPAVQSEIVRHIRALAEEIDILIVADYDENYQGTLTSIIMEAIKHHIECPVIGMSRNRLRILKGYDYIILDEEELANETDPDADLDRLSRIFDLFQITKAEHILLTLRGKGAALYNSRIEHTLPEAWTNAHIEETLVSSQELTSRINTCGCGDTFTAAFTICVASGMNHVEAIQRANAAARVQATKLYGAAIIETDEWESEYQTLYAGDKE